jgi:hypothetical protein
MTPCYSYYISKGTRQGEIEMNATQIAEAIEAKAAFLLTGPFTGHDAAGNPTRRGCQIINGHMVEVVLKGWEQRLVIFVDRSSEMLTTDQAVARVA